MATEAQIMKVLNSLYEFEGCPQCNRLIRWGDMECPHCGGDIEDALRDWAEKLVDAVYELGAE